MTSLPESMRACFSAAAASILSFAQPESTAFVMPPIAGFEAASGVTGYSAFDALLPAGLCSYWKSDFGGDIDDAAIAAHLEHGSRVPNVHSAMHIYPLDGAVSDVGSDETAFGSRDARFAVNIVGFWPDSADTEAFKSWVRGYYDAVHPFSGFEGGYTNFMEAEDQSRVRENYGPSYERLARVKAEWDPGNLFHLNQNIRPGEAATTAAA